MVVGPVMESYCIIVDDGGQREENVIEFDFHYCAVKLYLEIIKYCRRRIGKEHTTFVFLFEKSSFFSFKLSGGTILFLIFFLFSCCQKVVPPPPP